MVLVLLVLGILVIVRLFPSGFFSIESTGNAALADSLGQAAVQTQGQDAASLPEAILPGSLDTSLDLGGEADYDPDYNPNAQPDYGATLDKARNVLNETITVPSRTGGGNSVYVVRYGPIKLGGTKTPADPSAPIDPAGDLTQLSSYLTINSTNWTPQTGDSGVTAFSLLAPGRPEYLVDYSAGRIALPYANYPQECVLKVQDAKDVIHTLYLTLPKAYPVDAADATNPNGPLTLDKRDLRDSTSTNYNGQWFDPEDTTTLRYVTNQSPLVAGQNPPLPTPWKAVALYRPFKGVALTDPINFDNQPDPYTFMLASPNIGAPGNVTNGNVGAIAFSPLAAGGNGTEALKARISYQVYSWKILHEDRDIPALPTGGTFVTRLTLKNLKRAGDANPDNTIYTGMIPGSNVGVFILDLDTGKSIATATDTFDPTVTDFNDEDINGPSPNNSYKTKITDVSYSTGRLTFPANLDVPANGQAPGATPPRAHRLRIFYEGDADWTVAVQKAPAFYTLNSTDIRGGTTDPQLKPGEYAFDSATATVYFPRSQAGNTVEVDGTYRDAAGVHSLAATIAISPIVVNLGAGRYLSVNLADPLLSPRLPAAVAANQVTVTGVRGLSARAVVAWKERDRWKIHSVDTVPTRTP